MATNESPIYQTTTAMSSRTARVLNRLEDWDEWLDNLKVLATAHDVWNLCDPSLLVQPELLTKPVAPTVQSISAAKLDLDELTDDEYKKYSRKKESYKDKLAEYESQRLRLSKIEEHLLYTVGNHNKAWTRDAQTTYLKAQALKRTSLLQIKQSS